MASIFSRENLLRWLLALGCLAVVMFFFSPSWGAFELWSRVPEFSGMMEVRRGVSVLAQVAHPGAEIADPLHRAIQWRLLFPVIGHVLNLPPVVLFGLADLGCLVVLGYLITVLRRAGATWQDAALSGVTLGAASWFFVSTGWLGYFDSWLALSLLIIAFARGYWPVWAACVWAPWVDERFIMALPIALFCRYAIRAVGTAGGFPPLADNKGATAAAKSLPSAANSNSLPPAFSWKLEVGIPAALVVVFLFVRLGLLSGSSAADATLAGYFSGKNYLDAPLSRIGLGVWEGLRAGWLFVIVAVFALRRSPALAALAGVLVVVTIAAGLATAQDYSRSMTMLLPAAVLGSLLICQEKSSRHRLLLTGGAMVAVLLPAHHVMNDNVNPIYYLYHELAALESPPPAAMPELRELHAIHEMEKGNFAQAEQDLTLAIKLSRDPSGPAKQRGVLYASSRRWEDAKRDFTTVIENDPDSPDGWFLRSQVELAMRDIASARSDFEHARSIAPAGWGNRPDVGRYTALFNKQAGSP